MKTNKELMQMSVKDLKELSALHWEYVKRIDATAHYKNVLDEE